MHSNVLIRAWIYSNQWKGTVLFITFPFCFLFVVHLTLLILMYLIIVGDHSAGKGLKGLFLHNCGIEWALLSFLSPCVSLVTAVKLSSSSRSTLSVSTYVTIFIHIWNRDNGSTCPYIFPQKFGKNSFSFYNYTFSGQYFSSELTSSHILKKFQVIPKEWSKHSEEFVYCKKQICNSLFNNYCNTEMNQKARWLSEQRCLFSREPAEFIHLEPKA